VGKQTSPLPQTAEFVMASGESLGEQQPDFASSSDRAEGKQRDADSPETRVESHPLEPVEMEKEASVDPVTEELVRILFFRT
jgi:hypothetical protein